jgi:hypothetical protein
MITEQKIDDTIVRLSKLTEEEYISEYMAEMNKQTNISNFMAESADHFMLEKDSENSMLELCFQILNIYKDNFADKYEVISSDTIMNSLKTRKEIQDKQAEILNVDLSKDGISSIEKKYEEIKTELNKNPDKINSKYKELFAVNEKLESMRSQKNLFDYCAYFIENDKYTIERDKPAISSIIDVLLISLESQINGNNK